MTFWTMLMIKVKDGDAKAAAEAHTKRRSIEEAMESIPGFRHGETMLCADEPDSFCVMCGWEDEAAYQEWQHSPLRAKQVEDLAGVISAETKTICFQSIHVVNKTQTED
jgi:heme-degrading monooxygenase HmoA